VRVSVAAGTHHLNASDGIFDSANTASEVWIQGSVGGSTLLVIGDGPVFTFHGGEPNSSQSAPVHLHDLSIHGRVLVTSGSRLYVQDCSFGPSPLSPGAVQAEMGGGLLVAGGQAEVRSSSFVGFNAVSGGAIAITSGSLSLFDSVLASNIATNGGAIYASGGTLVAMGSRLEHNEAAHAGGGLYVGGGCDVLLGNGTWLGANRAPFLQGASAFVAAGSLTYGLPGPLATWVTSATRCDAARPEACGPGLEKLPELLGLEVARLSVGATDDSYPFSCTPGVFGDSLDILAQSRPSCSGPCPARFELTIS
jgi:predicted outer membrane repeat protein